MRDFVAVFFLCFVMCIQFGFLVVFFCFGWMCFCICRLNGYLIWICFLHRLQIIIWWADNENLHTLCGWKFYVHRISDWWLVDSRLAEFIVNVWFICVHYQFVVHCSDEMDFEGQKMCQKRLRDHFITTPIKRL